MARRTIVTYYSDVSGTEIDKSGVGVHFSLDGDAFEIDLSEEEHEALRQALAPFVAAARLASANPSRRPPAAGGDVTETEPNARTLRLWARETGFDVPARGRIPELAREAYKVANSHRDATMINRLLAPVSSPR